MGEGIKSSNQLELERDNRLLLEHITCCRAENEGLRAKIAELESSDPYEDIIARRTKEIMEPTKGQIQALEDRINQLTDRIREKTMLYEIQAETHARHIKALDDAQDANIKLRNEIEELRDLYKTEVELSCNLLNENNEFKAIILELPLVEGPIHVGKHFENYYISLTGTHLPFPKHPDEKWMETYAKLLRIRQTL